jgi:PAS domain S-box-containing protein/putative nucleotidyltransferase with HDIG domain
MESRGKAMAKVLIVDDERSIRETLSEFVREIGHETFLASEAGPALEIVANSIPDVVLCDIVLPGTDGMSILERIRRVSPDTQVVMITGEPTVKTAADAVRQGAFDYLSKPLSSGDIQAVVESALRVKQIADDRKRLEEENRRFREHLEEEVERKAAALAESEAQYRRLVETANEAVFVAQDGRLKFVNPKTMTITGYSEAELLSMPFPELIHPEDRELVVSRHTRRLAGAEEPPAYEFRILDAAGETKWVEIRPVRIEWEGRPAILNLAGDVTDRREAQERLRESEAFLESVFNAIRDGISVLDTDMNIIRTNPWMEEMYGQLAPLPGRKCFDAYQRRTKPCPWCPTLKTIETGEVRREIVPYPSEDAPSGWIELSTFPIKDVDGTVVRVIEYVKDITERVAAQRAREETETRYRTLFEISPISLWEEDYSEVRTALDDLRAGGIEDLEAHLRAHPEIVRECIGRIRIEDVNEATVALHGASSKEDLLGHLASVIPPESWPDFIPQLMAIADGSTSYEGEGVDTRLDGTKMHVAVRWTAAPGYEESLRRVLVSKVDITTAVEAEAALQRALAGTVEAIGLTTEMRDPYTAGHQQRVTTLAVAIAEELGLQEHSVDALRAAGLMHDIGKIGVPAEILSKPSALTEVEMSLIRAHPQVAFDILERISFPWPLAEIVLQHHERLDGSGYPRGLSGDDICIEAKVLAVADTVEAMASHRPYRAALGIDVALAEIEDKRGALYEVDIVDACIKLFREESFTFPEGEADASAGVNSSGSPESARP